MAKNTRTYWYDYADIDKILKSKNNNDFLYYVEDTTSQNSEQALQRIDDSFATLEANLALKATVIPINLWRIVRGVYEGSHWVGVVIRRNQETHNLEAFYNDSLGTSMDISLPNLRIILNNHGIPNERIIDFRHIQQNNGYDCGAWTVLNLDSLARTGKLLEATEDDVIDQRREVFGYAHVKISSIAKTDTEATDEEGYEADSELSDDNQSIDSDSEIQDSSNPVPELEELKISDQNHIKFVLNVPMYVPLENTGELSPDATDDSTFEEDLFNFDSDDKSSLPFRTFDIGDKVRISKSKKTPGKEIKKQIIKHRTGLLESDDSGDRDELFVQGSTSEEYSRAHKLLELLTKGGCDEVHKDYIGNIGVSIGLNRPLSLSTRKNSCLEKELHRIEKSTVKYKKAAFFWDMPWTDQEGNIAKYDDVKKFYKQLKRKDSAKAKKFLEINEDLERPSPPYQYIREYVKDHQNTKELVQSLRTDDAVIYFSSIDSDTKHFNGIYSSYLKIIAKSKNLPTVMSTGYEFAEEYDGFPLHVGSKLERIIRIVTAKTLSGGVYYPEPNFCVLIPADDDTLPYSFIDKKIVESNLESPVLLRQVLQRPDCIMVFSNDNPLITSGDRAQKSEPQFSDTFQNGGAPSEDDLSKLSQIIQSTANPRDWAQGIYYNRCFEIKGKGIQGVVGLFRGYIDDLFKGKNIEDALSKLNKIVHPTNIVDSLYEAVNNLKYVLDKFYHPFEEYKIQDDDLYTEILVQFYGLSSYDILTIIHILDVDELYRALNAYYSLCEICKLYQVNYEKFKAAFSKKSEIINESIDGIFADISYEDLEELYDRIILSGGSTQDFEELLYDDNGLFNDKCGDLDFNEVKEQFLSFLKPAKGISDLELYDIDDYEDLENKSAYNDTVDHLASQFEKEYGRDEDYEEEDAARHISVDDTIELVNYPEGSYKYFQQSILGYGDRFHNLLEDVNFIAASNLDHVPGARNKVIQKLLVLLSKLNVLKEENGMTDESFEILESFQEAFPEEVLQLSNSEIASIESIRNINRQISEASDLRDLLLSSLEAFPDNPDSVLGGLPSPQSDDSEYY